MLSCLGIQHLLYTQVDNLAIAQYNLVNMSMQLDYQSPYIENSVRKVKAHKGSLVLLQQELKK